MKNLIVTIPLFFLAASCGSKDSTTSMSGISETKPLTNSILEQSKMYDESTVISAAGSGVSLASSVAEKCWSEEKSRPQVQAACVLAWSTGSESSEFLSARLRESIEEPSKISRLLAISAVRKSGFVAKLNFQNLKSLLGELKSESIWLRAGAAVAWASKNTFTFFQGEQIWETLKTNDEDLSPADLSELHLLAEILGSGHWQTVLDGFCKPSVLGYAQSRCWRLLSAIVNPETGEGLSTASLPFLRSRKDSGWSLFERSFPERAFLLKKYL